MATCAISGNLPEEPVVSLKSGHIFEKRLIIKHLSLHSTCPITHQPLAESDLLTIQTVNPITRPRPPTATSFPALLNLLQTEYDAILLETFTLRQQYEQIRTDLAKAHYQQDASNRVIARLYQENEQLKSKLNDIDANINSKGAFIAQQSSSLSADESGMAMDDGDTTTTAPTDASSRTVNEFDTIIAFGKDAFERIGGPNRRPMTKRRTKESKTIVDYSQYTLLSSLQYPSSYLTSLDTQYDISMHLSLKTTTAVSANGLISFVGTQTGHVLVIQNQPSTSTSRVILSIPVSDHPITSIATTHDYSMFPWAAQLSTSTTPSGSDQSRLRGMYSFSVGLDAHECVMKTYVCYAEEEIDNLTSWVPIFTSSKHGGSISHIQYHPSNNLIITASTDHYLRGFQLNASGTGGKCLLELKVDGLSPLSAIYSMQLHPDARLLALTTTGKTLLVDLFTGKVELSLIEKDTAQPVHGITFSQNGFNAITYTRQQGYTLWDLRQVKANEPSSGIVKQYDHQEIHSAHYDYTATSYMLVLPQSIQIINTKNDATITTLSIGDQSETPSSLIDAKWQHNNDAIIAIAPHKVYIFGN